MNRKEAIKAIEQCAQEGKSKREIFAEFSSKVKYRSDLMQYIAMVPSNENRLRYKKLNLVLFSLLVFVSVMKFLTGALLFSNISVYLIPIALLVPLLSAYFAVMIWNYRGNMYRILGMLGIAGLLNSLSKMEAFESYSSMEIAVEIFLGYLPTIIIIYLAYYIGIKAFPYYNFWGQLQESKLKVGS
jgi:hypothetical protein